MRFIWSVVFGLRFLIWYYHLWQQDIGKEMTISSWPETNYLTVSYFPMYHFASSIYLMGSLLKVKVISKSKLQCKFSKSKLQCKFKLFSCSSTELTLLSWRTLSVFRIKILDKTKNIWIKDTHAFTTLSCKYTMHIRNSVLNKDWTINH